MGVVVAARHVDLGHLVAVKIMARTKMTNVEGGERFLREARVLARLRSDHLAKVQDVGKLPSGEPFMVMEYLEGQDLAAFLAENGRVPHRTATDYVLQALEALAEAHEHGVIHRDLKPGNLFLARSADGTPFVKLIDFGLAKLQSQPTLTAAEMVFGSPHYMSPEQLDSAHKADARSDVFSLAACLYELIGGVPPFDGPSVAAVIHRVLHDEPEPLRVRLPDVPAGLDAVVLRGLAKSRDARYQSAAAFAHALDPFAEGTGRAARIDRVIHLQREGVPASMPATPSTERVDVRSPTIPAPAPPTEDDVATTRELAFPNDVHRTRLVSRHSLWITSIVIGLVFGILVCVGIVLGSRRSDLDELPPSAEPAPP